ncbi:hypothetical protein [Nitrosomonas sp.]|uniref:hypothetical protein n=1 Tax=Nitrosomonas sp. TaxID=42353 RepID=UPI0025F890EC|nr:hypothetical protein [Nitrosomonas sp.]
MQIPELDQRTKMLFECMQLAPVKFDSLTDRDTTTGLFVIPTGYSGIESRIQYKQCAHHNGKNKDLTSASTTFSILDLSPSFPRPSPKHKSYLIHRLYSQFATWPHAWTTRGGSVSPLPRMAVDQ